MKRNILIAVATLALGASVAPAAPGYGYREGDRSGRYEDRGGRSDGDRYGDRNDRSEYGGDRREVRRGYDEHDGHVRQYEDRYVVHFHLDGGEREVRAQSHDRAHRIVALLESVGVDAHVDGHRVVHFEMRGEREVVRRSHADAHRLAQKLEGYGFHAHVDHE
jgi:hypothetical protein